MSRTFKQLVTLFALLCLCAQACADDFSTDPELASEWTQYVFYSGDLVTSTWNSADGDLDLTRPAGQSGIGLYCSTDTRSATDPVTLTVKELNRADDLGGCAAGLYYHGGRHLHLAHGADRPDDI